MLTGEMGNMTVSYDGLELLPELLRAGRLHQALARGVTACRQKPACSWRGVLVANVWSIHAGLALAMGE